MSKLRNGALVLLLFLTIGVSAQIKEYQFKRKIELGDETWNRLKIPEEILDEAKFDLRDLRVYGVSTNDTVSAPFVLRDAKHSKKIKERSFERIDESKTSGGWYYTFRLEEAADVSQINLRFAEKNFDKRIRLEGSHDQINWFELLDDYRILSIKNQHTDYSFSQLDFKRASYKYFRLFVPGSEQLDLTRTKVRLCSIVEGDYVNTPFSKATFQEIADGEWSEWFYEFDKPVSLSNVEANVKADYDFHRKIQIDVVVDSISNKQGLVYRYNQLYRGVLSSLEVPKFFFPQTRVKKLRVRVYNGDNEALELDDFVFRFYQKEMLLRITKAAEYYLYYGKQNASKPSFDISQFDLEWDKAAKAVFGPQLQNAALTEPADSSSFQSGYWLWAIMSLIVVLLLYFSYQMISKAG